MPFEVVKDFQILNWALVEDVIWVAGGGNAIIQPLHPDLPVAVHF